MLLCSLSFHSLVIDVTMALDTLSLPVLEPLTPGRLLDVTVLALSCLYAGRFFTTSSFTKNTYQSCSANKVVLWTAL